MAMQRNNGATAGDAQKARRRISLPDFDATKGQRR